MTGMAMTSPQAAKDGLLRRPIIARTVPSIICSSRVTGSPPNSSKTLSIASTTRHSVGTWLLLARRHIARQGPVYLDQALCSGPREHDTDSSAGLFTGHTHGSTALQVDTPAGITKLDGKAWGGITVSAVVSRYVALLPSLPPSFPCHHRRKRSRHIADLASIQRRESVGRKRPQE